MEANDSETLGLMKAIAQTRMDSQMAEDFAIPGTAEVFGTMMDGLVVQLRQMVMGREMESVECRYPADWWQAVKARWLPRWARRRWPVIERTVMLTARELYPKVAMPEADYCISLSRRDTVGEAT